ncbi:MAG: septation protein IspZ, partial [Pseudomonadota bacterium]
TLLTFAMLARAAAWCGEIGVGRLGCVPGTSGGRMDRRLILELLPGVAFLLGNAIGGLLWAAAVAVVATAVAVGTRWRWDGRMPWLAVSTLVLALVLTGFGVAFNNETFVLIRPTVGAFAFAAISGVGASCILHGSRSPSSQGSRTRSPVGLSPRINGLSTTSSRILRSSG